MNEQAANIHSNNNLSNKQNALEIRAYIDINDSTIACDTALHIAQDCVSSEG